MANAGYFSRYRVIGLETRIRREALQLASDSSETEV
jgi:hypothetical protein